MLYSIHTVDLAYSVESKNLIYQTHVMLYYLLGYITLKYAISLQCILLNGVVYVAYLKLYRLSTKYATFFVRFGCVKFLPLSLSESRIFGMARRVCGITEGAEYAEDTEKPSALAFIA